MTTIPRRFNYQKEDTNKYRHIHGKNNFFWRLVEHPQLSVCLFLYFFVLKSLEYKIIVFS